MSSGDERLPQACASLFVFLATFRRNAGTARMGAEALHRELERELESVRERCQRDRRLAPLLERVWYALVAATDQAVLTSSWPERASWSMRLLEQQYFGTSEGGKRFYDVVEEVLSDPTDAAAEMAEVLFECMSLGFQGMLIGERQELERRRRLLFEKARLAGALGDSLTPEAYGRNASRRLVKLPTVGTLRLLAVAGGALLLAALMGQAARRIHSGETPGEIQKVIEDIEGAAKRR